MYSLESLTEEIWLSTFSHDGVEMNLLFLVLGVFFLIIAIVDLAWTTLWVEGVLVQLLRD